MFQEGLRAQLIECCIAQWSVGGFSDLHDLVLSLIPPCTTLSEPRRLRILALNVKQPVTPSPSSLEP